MTLLSQQCIGLLSLYYSATEEFEALFVARDWGFLFLLFAMLIFIRFFLLAAFYPRESLNSCLYLFCIVFCGCLTDILATVISRIGIGTNWKEAAVRFHQQYVYDISAKASYECLTIHFLLPFSSWDGVDFVEPSVLPLL